MKNNKPVRYVYDSWLELTKVKWPTQKEIINTTIAVIISLVAATAITAAVDYGLTSLVQYIVAYNK